jgi:hypothetical protein
MGKVIPLPAVWPPSTIPEPEVTVEGLRCGLEYAPRSCGSSDARSG